MVVTYTIPGLYVTEHEVVVPLDWSDPDDGHMVTIFVREVVDPARRREDLPCLLYLQGGPGGKSPRPLDTSGWLGRALQTHRVVLLDQRGTGRSSRIDKDVIAGLDAAAGADYLNHFRADSIVADAEYVRKKLYGGRRWLTLGQSFGGFITLTYLSKAPEGLSGCVVAGGLPDIDPDPEAVYRRTYPRVEHKNRIYYERFSEDRERVGAIADYLGSTRVIMADGDPLSVRRFQTLGLDFGMGTGLERVHWMIDEAFGVDGRLTDSFVQQVGARTAFTDNPLFAVLQESIYGHGHQQACWAAERIRTEFAQFAADRRPLLFTGEMIYPWMFSEIRALRPFAPAMDLLAGQDRWSELYDHDRLAANEVPIVAAVYLDDMYVDFELQRKTIDRIGSLHTWMTNEYQHDGIHHPGVLERLLTMIDSYGGPLPDSAAPGDDQRQPDRQG